MTVHLGVIADDFTGATDIASMLRRSGYPVSLRLDLPAANDPPAAGFEVIALKIRTAPADEAVAAAEAACDWLTSNGARQIYWKYCSTFDSTAKGNIGPVAEALMNRLGVTQTIYSPAFPENERRVFLGHLFVGDRLLSDSSMKDHPLTPMRQPDLRRVLEAQVTRPVGLVDHATISDEALAIRHRLEILRRQGIAHVILDAIEDQHLRAQASAVGDYKLLTGGSALAQFLPDYFVHTGVPLAENQAAGLPETGDGILTLSGSGSEMTRAQVDYYKKRATAFSLDPASLAASPAHLEAARDWLAAQPPAAPKIVYATAAPDAVQRAQEALGRERAGHLIEEALATIAETAADMGYQRFVVAGGETSGAVVRRLGLTSLSLGPEIAPGVPWTYGERSGKPVAVALKSGNFGEVTFFEDALAGERP